MGQAAADHDLVARLQRLVQGRLDVLGPTIVQWQGAPYRLLVRRISAVSQFLVESAVLHAAVTERVGHPSDRPAILLVSAPMAPRDTGSSLLALLAAAGCADFRFAIIAAQGPHLLRLDPGPAQHMDDASSGLIAPQVRGLSCAPAQFWVMRALLLAGPRTRTWWRGPMPKSASWTSALELAQAGDLAPSTVARTIQVLEERSWVAKERSGFRVLDPAAMIQAFADEGVRRWGRRQPMRLTWSDAQGPAAVHAFWAKFGALAPHAVAETGWGALGRDRLAVAPVSGRVPEVLLPGSGGTTLVDRPLVPAPLRDAQLVVHLGALQADIPQGGQEGMPAVDPLLAMYHVAGDPQGGQEQAAHLRERICEALQP